MHGIYSHRYVDALNVPVTLWFEIERLFDSHFKQARR